MNLLHCNLNNKSVDRRYLISETNFDHSAQFTRLSMPAARPNRLTILKSTIFRQN